MTLIISKNWKKTEIRCILLLPENELEECIRPEMKTEWERLRSSDCSDSFSVGQTGTFVQGTCCQVHKEHDKSEPELFKEEFKCKEMLFLYSKTYCCCAVTSHKFELRWRGFNKHVSELNGDGPMDRYRHTSWMKDLLLRQQPKVSA